MSHCLHCNARIPAGRSYCHPHYVAALRDYEREVADYQQERQAWESLSLLTELDTENVVLLRVVGR